MVKTFKSIVSEGFQPAGKETKLGSKVLKPAAKLPKSGHKLFKPDSKGPKPGYKLFYPLTKHENPRAEDGYRSCLLISAYGWRAIVTLSAA